MVQRDHSGGWAATFLPMFSPPLSTCDWANSTPSETSESHSWLDVFEILHRRLPRTGPTPNASATLCLASVTIDAWCGCCAGVTPHFSKMTQAWAYCCETLCASTFLWLWMGSATPRNIWHPPILCTGLVFFIFFLRFNLAEGRLKPRRWWWWSKGSKRSRCSGVSVFVRHLKSQFICSHSPCNFSPFSTFLGGSSFSTDPFQLCRSPRICMPNPLIVPCVFCDIVNKSCSRKRREPQRSPTGSRVASISGFIVIILHCVEMVSLPSRLQKGQNPRREK